MLVPEGFDGCGIITFTIISVSWNFSFLLMCLIIFFCQTCVHLTINKFTIDGVTCPGYKVATNPKLEGGGIYQ